MLKHYIISQEKIFPKKLRVETLKPIYKKGGETNHTLIIKYFKSSGKGKQPGSGKIKQLSKRNVSGYNIIPSEVG